MTARRTMLEFDVARDQWSAFLDEFSAEHRSWLATVERCGASGAADVIAGELPLLRVSVDDACDLPQAIHVTFAGNDPAASRGVDIPDPIALRLVEPPGRVPWLEVHQTDGRCTRVRFRDVPLPELLDGVAPAEAEPPGSG